LYLDEVVKQLQKKRCQSSPEEDYTSFVIISSSEAEQGIWNKIIKYNGFNENILV